MINLEYDNCEASYISGEDMVFCDQLYHKILSVTNKLVYLPHKETHMNVLTIGWDKES